MDTNSSENKEIWQVDAGGQIYQATFEEMTQWVFEGSLLPQDLVKRGNLRWIEARKVPSLVRFFNARENGEAPPVTTTMTAAQANPLTPPTVATVQPAPNTATFVNHAPTVDVGGPAPVAPALDPEALPPVCSLHDDRAAAYVCETCINGFCTACPKSYGGSVKICPFCGAMCRSVKEIAASQARSAVAPDLQLSDGVGLGDLMTALAYPFRYKTSYVFGGFMFMLFSLGQSAGAMGSIMLAAAALICAMLANMLTFGVLSNVINDFSQGKIGGDFMPKFDDFSLWDDVVHPFFLSIAVYLVSFGLVIAVVVGGFLWGMNQLRDSVGKDPAMSQFKVLNPDGPIRNNPAIAAQNERYAKGSMPDEKALNGGEPFDEEKYFNDLNDDINQLRKSQLESSIGKAPETVEAEQMAMIQNFAKAAVPLLIVAFIGVLWGLFYFPAACSVAGYTKSFWQTLNPLVGIETIRILGLDYVKVWFMSALISIMWSVGAGIVAAVLSPFAVPRFGNPLATAVGAWIGFYFAIAFAVLLGLMIYKNAARLQLFQAK